AVAGAVEHREEVAMRRRALLGGLVGLAGMAGVPQAAGAQDKRVLRVVMHSDLKILDPIWTTALISSHHGYLVYDTLFSLDEKLVGRPPQVYTRECCADN